MLVLLKQMAKLHHPRWHNKNGAIGGQVYMDWSRDLADFSPSQIKAGLAAVVAEGSDYLPDLIKFLRLCRESEITPVFVPQLNRPKPHYSVMAIERAKQRALTGSDFKPSKEGNRLIMDRTIEDEVALCDLIVQWDKSTGHDGLNKLIDNYQFSQGTHYSKTRMI